MKGKIIFCSPPAVESGATDTEIQQATVATLEADYSYGVEWQENTATCTRIGNLELHKSLPIQSQYKGCVYDTINKEFKYWLDENDWSKKADGTASDLTGADGSVMVYTPRFFGKSGSYTKNSKTYYWVRISTIQIDDSWVEIPAMYIGAYLFTIATINNKTTAMSVVNTTAAYRGGGGRDSYDLYFASNPCRSDLGKQRTNITRANARTYANNAKTRLLCYEHYKWIFWWNYVIEYNSFNCQDSFNGTTVDSNGLRFTTLDSNGYHVGGLGAGVTTWQNTSTTWSGYNATYPIVPCGYSNDLGNRTGVKKLNMVATSGITFPSGNYFWVPRWRGFENPFGHIWTCLDGIVVDASGDTDVVYTTDLYKDVDNYGVTGVWTNLDTKPTNFSNVSGIYSFESAHANAWNKEFNLRSRGDMFPATTLSSESGSKRDYHYSGDKNSTLRRVLSGGTVNHGSSAGLSFLFSNSGVSSASTFVGYRFVSIIE